MESRNSASEILPSPSRSNTAKARSTKNSCCIQILNLFSFLSTMRVFFCLLTFLVGMSLLNCCSESCSWSAGRLRRNRSSRAATCPGLNSSRHLFYIKKSLSSTCWKGYFRLVHLDLENMIRNSISSSIPTLPSPSRSARRKSFAGTPLF